MPRPPVRIEPLGDRAFVVTVGASADERTRRRVGAVAARLGARGVAGLVECVPAYASVTVHYDPARVAALSPPSRATSPGARFAAALAEEVDAALRGADDAALAAQRVVDVPVCYGGALGPDLDAVARHHGLAEAEVVRLHAAGEYVVHMVGFAPGFPYLGGLTERLATPRRATPRARVPASSVAIGGAQTGIYSVDSPGGWHVIGRTPLRLFDPARDPPALLRAGDRVRFRAVTRDEFDSLG